MDKKLTYWLGSIIGVIVLAAGMTYGMLQFAEVPMGSDKHAFAESDYKEAHHRMKQKLKVQMHNFTSLKILLKKKLFQLCIA
ncbi:hypothetical protein IEE_02209 [Bacillus cereus BAG5X1-1]|uniref:Uncharacterized protein n=1 Tax=Bacillus cereus BAG5X1-1 TaxID=1053189 RepID=J8ABD2_BACCE|nr:hypothetical protein IEE_02209 [Bacillus cereus BAG5X1-1]